MDEQGLTKESTTAGPTRTHLTTVVLEEHNDGHWRATQTGINVVGVGDSAVEAATTYCSKISEGADAT